MTVLSLLGRSRPAERRWPATTNISSQHSVLSKPKSWRLVA